MTRIFLYGQESKPGVMEAAGRVRELVKTGRNLELVGEDFSFGKDLSAVDADLIMALGGDGTVLHLARHLFGKQVPVLSVNLGRLGFLAEVGLDDVGKVLENFAAGDAYVSVRMMLECEVLTCEGDRKEWFRALNDVVLSREGGRMMTVRVSCGDVPVMEFPGDGVIVATPTGSTAYGLSAGGPILAPELEVMEVVPVSPHSLVTRPVVVGGDEAVKVSLGKDTPAAMFTVDGQERAELMRGEVLSVKRAAEPFLLVTTGKHPFQTVREKLNWLGDTRLEWSES